MPSKASNRRRAHAAKSGGPSSFGELKLPHAVAEWRGRRIAAFQRLTPGQQEERISRAAAFAGRLGAASAPYESASCAAAVNRAAVANDVTHHDGWWGVAADHYKDSGERTTYETFSSLTAGQALAFNTLLAYAGEAAGGAFYRRCKAKCKSRDREAEMFKEAYRLSLFAPTVVRKGPEPLTVQEALAAGKAGGLGMVGKIAIAASAVAAAEKEATAAAEAAAEAAAAAKAKAKTVSDAKRWRWQRVFEQIVRKAFDVQDKECEWVSNKNCISWYYYEKFEVERDWFDTNHKSLQQGDFAHLDDVYQVFLDAESEYVAARLEVLGFGHFARYWCARATKRVAAAKKAAPRPKRLNAAARLAEQEAVRRTLLPSYLMTTAASAYTRPVEEIRSVRFGNLPLASGMKQCAELRNAMRDFAVRNGAVLAEAKKGDGNIFCPQRGANTIGFGFIKCVTAANAQLFLERVRSLEHPMLVDPVTGDERELLIELAASEHKTKSQMEAEKAAKAATVTSETKRIINMMKAANSLPTTVPKLLEPVCLGAAVKAAKDAAVLEAEEAMRTRLAFMFSSSLPTTVDAPVAKQFEVCYAAVAAKPVVKPTTVIVDPFSTIINGEKYGVFYDRSTELGKAQAALQAHLEAEAAKPALMAQRKRRAERKKRNAGKDAWEQEQDSDTD